MDLNEILTYTAPSMGEVFDLSQETTARKAFEKWLQAKVFPLLLREGRPTYKFLALPPDRTRRASLSGEVLQWFVKWLVKKKVSFTLDILPTTGTHRAMESAELKEMFGNLVGMPGIRFLEHDYLRDVGRLGTFSFSDLEELKELRALSQKEGWDEGTLPTSFTVDVCKTLFENYSCILSLGQVLPHEILGMSNYTKNIMIGLGGKDIIDQTHFLAGLVGMDKIIGRVDNPLRKLVDAAYEKFVRPHRRIFFLHTVLREISTASSGKKSITLAGASFGLRNREREQLGESAADGFRWAAALAEEVAIHDVDQPKKYLFAEFPEAGMTSTWIVNKAIYRLRRAAASRATLVILAPGLRGFGETPGIDAFIEKHGYCSREQILEQLASAEHKKTLGRELAVLGHLIYGHTGPGLTVKYAIDPSKLAFERMRKVGYEAISISEGMALREQALREDPSNTLCIYNPGLGYWRVKEASME